jgi:hypothetical protein
MEVPTELYTTSTLFTLGGSAAAVWIITSVINHLIGSDRIQKFKKWIGFILSLGLAILGATLIEERTVLIWVVAVVNGFLVFLTAAGLNALAAGKPEKEKTRRPVTRGIRGAGSKALSIFSQRW